MKKYSGIYLDKNTNKYYVSTTFLTKDGYEVRKCKRGFETLRDADAWKQNEKIKISKTELKTEKKKKSKLTKMFEDYINYQSVRIKPTTLRSKKALLNTNFIQYFNNKIINDITPNQIQNYYESICNNSKIKISSKNAIINEVLLFVEWLDLMEYIDSSVFKKFKRIMTKLTDTEEHRGDFLSQDEIKKLLNEMDYSTIKGKEQRLFYMISVYSGLRLGETLGLTYNDVDFENRSIRVNKQMQQRNNTSVIVPYTKTNQIKYVDIPSELAEHIMEYKQLTNSSDDDFIITHSRSVIREKLHRDLEKLGIKDVRIHDLRHSYCTMLYDMGADEKYVAKQMGHSSSITSKKTYEHLTEAKNQKNKTNVIDNLMD